LVFITELESVYSAVRTVSLKKQSAFVFKGLMFFTLHEGKDEKEKRYSAVNYVYFEMILGSKAFH
jgi:hypothetical protein